MIYRMLGDKRRILTLGQDSAECQQENSAISRVLLLIASAVDQSPSSRHGKILVDSAPFA